MRHTFRVDERLKREQHIHTLFQSGKAFSVFPVRFIYLPLPRAAATDAPVQAGFSVPKKKIRSSVKRHRIRRLMAEAWRLNKHLLYAALPADRQLHLFLIFTAPAVPEYLPVQEAVLQGIGQLIKIMGQNNQQA